MITTLLTSSVLGTCEAAGLAPALTGFVTRLTGDGPSRELGLPADRRPLREALASADVVVFTASAHTGTLDEPSRLTAEYCARNNLLARKVAFPVVVGGWPAAAGLVPHRLTLALSAGGAISLAPALHLPGGPQDVWPAIATFCEHWAPALPALLQLARAGAAPPAAA